MSSRAKRKPAAAHAGGGGGGSKKGRGKSQVEEEDDDEEDEGGGGGGTQFTQPTEDETSELWSKRDACGPLDTTIAEHIGWKPTVPKRPPAVDGAAIPDNVTEDAVKWVTKRLLASAMQRQNRKVQDLYGTLGKELKDFLKAKHQMTAKTGRKRVPKREDMDAFFLGSCASRQACCHPLCQLPRSHSASV